MQLQLLTSMIKTDYSQRFLFENSRVRGERVYINQNLQKSLKTHSYPVPIQYLLGELCSSAILLSSILKFDGTFTLQARSKGPVQLLMAECNNQQKFRCFARYSETIGDQPLSLNEQLPDGQLLITANPKRGKQYQSIVVLNQPTLAECFTSYFRQSEQLPTKLWLASNEKCASGLLLQKLPENQHAIHSCQSEKEWNQWQHLVILADTVTRDELLSLDNKVLIHRLFHEEDIRLFDALDIMFQCTCSRQRVINSLITLGDTELKKMSQEAEPSEIKCQFCNKLYTFSSKDIRQLYHQ